MARKINLILWLATVIFVAFIFTLDAKAKDVQWSQGYTGGCVNASEREDGSILPLSEISLVRYLIIPKGSTIPKHTVMMNGGCANTFIDTKRNVPVGSYLIHGITVDTDGNESVLSLPGVLLNVIKSNPKPPSGLR